MEATFYQGAPLMVDHTPSGAAVSAGQVVVVGDTPMVAHKDIADGALGALAAGGGVYKVAADAAIAAGKRVVWDDTNNKVSTTATGKPFGFTLTAASADGDLIYVAHEPAAAATAAGQITAAIADPGNAGAIPVTGSGYVPIVTAGAETRTIAAPTFVGQELLVYMKTDGGDAVITVATGINQTGNNTITMNDAGDSIRLVAIESGSNKRWRVAFNDGCSLSTV